MDNANDVNTVLKSSGVEKDFAQKALKRSIFSDDATIALKGLKNSGDSLTSLENIFTGIGTTLKATLTNPLTWIAGAGIAAVGALIYKATEFDRAVNTSTKSQSAYASSANELSELTSQLDTAAARISELQALKQQQKISPAESTELNLLILQNSELERQILLKEKSASRLSDIAVNDALSALKQKNTVDLVPTENSENGSDTKKVYDDFGTAYYAYDQTDILTAT